MAIELADESYVRTLLSEQFGAVLQKIPEPGNAPSVDFELLEAGVRTAVMEVKTLKLTPRTPELGWKKEGLFMTRTDNSVRRVGKLIHDAWKQLRLHDVRKVLVVVNDEHGAKC